MESTAEKTCVTALAASGTLLLDVDTLHANPAHEGKIAHLAAHLQPSPFVYDPHNVVLVGRLELTTDGELSATQKSRQWWENMPLPEHRTTRSSDPTIPSSEMGCCTTHITMLVCASSISRNRPHRSK